MSSSPEEFREFADECITWAKAAQLEQERALFLQMARTLIEAAAATSSTQHQEATKPRGILTLSPASAR